MRIAVFGATGGTGRHVMAQALDGGHEVHALVRSRESGERLGHHERLRVVVGRLDAPADVDAVVAGSDAVISALGGAQRGPTSVCADGIAAVLASMRRHGVRRLLAVSAHGAAGSRDGSPYSRAVWATRSHRMRDKDRMEELSGRPTSTPRSCGHPRSPTAPAPGAT
jgi:putative NADH-flavin reductase